jgi:phosphoribosylanthranilate isomerase
MACVKICGITNLEDALVAADAGADLVGFVFVPSSPRYIEPERAREIVLALKARGAAPRCVGVFVNDPLERVRAVMELVRLDVAQLHGNEPPRVVQALNAHRPERHLLRTAGAVQVSEGLQSSVKEILRFAQNDGIGAYKALRPRDEAEAQAQVAEYRAVVNGQVPAFIVDAFHPQRFGGTGQCADWSLAALVALEFPILLAGGLCVENIADAIRAVRPWGVDVSSGVERAPGLKDHDKVREFIQTAKGILRGRQCT